MDHSFLMLGIESSCDETAAALVRADGSILASEIASQMEVHAAHGGVVPEGPISMLSIRSFLRPWKRPASPCLTLTVLPPPAGPG